MQSGEDRASYWARLFRCTTSEGAEAEVAALGADPALAGLSLGAWRVHRAAIARADARLEARTRDLEALQAFGRSLAEARDVVDLMHRAAMGLQSLTEADAVAVAAGLSERSSVDIYLARPLAPADERRLREAVALGFVPLEADPAPAVRLPAFDGYQGPRASVGETDIVVVPVDRRGSEALRVAVVPRAGASERGLRLLFGASNHLAVHLDRVMAVNEAEQGRFRAILDSMPHAVVLTDASFRIVQANRSAERLLPRLGDDASTALRGVGDLDLVALAYEVLTGRSDEAEGEARLPDGGCLEIAVAPWREGADRPAGLVVVMLDITTARQLREQVTQSEKLSSLGRMIAGVAHEINNPLTAVFGYAQILGSAPLDPKSLQRVETIRKEAERCRRIVQNLLRFARSHTPARKAMSLNEVAENVAQLLSYPVRAAGCRLVLDLDRTLPAIVGDAHEIEQAVVNLVTNAQQAMTTAGRHGAVTIRTFVRDDGWVGLEVTDEGPGIPDEIRSRVFDPFFTTKAPGQGTGLGLWLVYNMAAAHGGRLDVGGSRAGGARLTVEFPSREDARTSPPIEASAAPEPAAEARVSAKILVLDAEEALAALICEALTAEGHVAVASHEAADALARLSGEPFDLVVSDAALPGLPGERLWREVGQRQPELRNRIVLTSSDWVTREPESVARQLGTELLRKPFELDELRRLVRTRLSRAPEH